MLLAQRFTTAVTHYLLILLLYLTISLLPSLGFCLVIVAFTALRSLCHYVIYSIALKSPLRILQEKKYIWIDLVESCHDQGSSLVRGPMPGSLEITDHYRYRLPIRFLFLVQSPISRMTKSGGKQHMICVYVRYLKALQPLITLTYYAWLKISLGLAFQVTLRSGDIYHMPLSFSGPMWRILLVYGSFLFVSSQF